MEKRYRVLRFLLHRVIPGRVRQVVYTIPYWFHINLFMRSEVAEKTPLFTYIELETINRCNGTCSFCPVNANEPQRPFAKMNDELFFKIVADLERLKYKGEIHLFSNNEPFLDERIIEYARYLRERLADCYISVYTNGTLLDEEKTIEICKSINLLVIDNYTSDGHIPNHLTRIMELVQKNEWLEEKVQIENRNISEVLSTRGGQAPNKKKTMMWGMRRGCIYPYRQLVIRPDGKCSLCCNDALGKYTMGDANLHTLEEIWYSEAYTKLRGLMKTIGRDATQICKNCDTHYFDKT